MRDISSVTNTIKMAILLQSRGKMKGLEIAHELGVTERQVLKYKNYLDDAGIWVESKPGVYGGYSIIGSNLLGLNINEKDIIVLDMIKEQLIYNNDINKSEFIEIVDRLKAIVNSKEGSKSYMDYFTVQPKCNYDYKTQKKLCEEIIYAYVTKRKIKINYNSLSSGLNVRIIHPYGLFNYKGDTYLVAYCENRKKFLDFKICRIHKYEVLENRYKIDTSFSWNEYSKNCIGIYKDEEINIVLKIKNPFSAIVKEKIWVDNQVITENDDDTITFKATMKGYSEIKSWILSMGANVEVIAPIQLREDIISEIEKIKKLY